MYDREKIRNALTQIREAMEKQSEVNPAVFINLINVVSDIIKNCLQQIDEKSKYLYKLCDSWKPEYFNDYLRVIGEIEDLYDEIHRLSNMCRLDLKKYHSE